MFGRRSHYDYLEDHLLTFFAAVGLNIDIYHKGMITAHGDKAYSYRDQWERGGLHFFHGVAIYLLSYCKPFSAESRETPAGWVDVGQWVLDNKDRFLPYLPPTGTDMKLTPLETKVLNALFDSSKGNGHDFGLIEEARSEVGTPRALAGVVASLVKKDIITIHGKVNDWTQFTFNDFPTVETWHKTQSK